MIELIEFADQLNNAKNEDELNQFVMAALAQVGYENVVISTYSQKDGPKLLFYVAPDGWDKTYMEDKKFFLIDPAYKTQAAVWDTHTWKDAFSIETSKPVQDFVNISEECGLRHGVTASGAACGLKINLAASSRARHPDGHERKIMGLTSLLAAGYSHKLSEFHRKSTKLELSPQENEVVRWILAGENTNGISDKMNISEHTARTYIQRIMERNGLKSRLQIAVQALINGQAQL